MPFFQPRFLLVCLFCLLAVGLSAQNSREELQKREQELQKELADLNRLYNETQNNKKLSLKQLAIIKSKINRREELVNSINKQIRQLDETIYLKERDVYRLRRELDTLRQKYAKSLVFAFKHRSNYEYLNFLFSAINFNDAIKRVTYLRSYRRNRETQAVAIAKSEVLLKEKIELLNSSKKERMSTLVVQNEQLKVLQTDKKEQDKVVEQLKGKEKELTAQIRDKEKQRQRVQQAFQAIIRREIDEAKKRETARIKAQEEKAKTQPARPSGGPSAGVVTAHFGIENIPGTKLKRKTDGIEISLPVGSVVKCVADGRISYISEVEGEQVIIIQHGKYFTGYTNLSSVSVNKNQEVKAGTVLGRSGVSIDGEGSLIFMITNEKSTPIDPEIWLKSRK